VAQSRNGGSLTRRSTKARRIEALGAVESWELQLLLSAKDKPTQFKPNAPFYYFQTLQQRPATRLGFHGVKKNHDMAQRSLYEAGYINPTCVTRLDANHCGDAIGMARVRCKYLQNKPK